MRMDQTRALTAAEVLNTYPAGQLARILRDYGEERFARRIADAIVRERARAPLSSTSQLAEIVRDSIPAPARRTGGHPAKRTFQALRIEVNGELEALHAALPGALDRLAVGGRIVVLAYHSLEDRAVKTALARRRRTPRRRDCRCRWSPRGPGSGCSPGGRSGLPRRNWPATREPHQPGCGRPSGSGTPRDRRRGGPGRWGGPGQPEPEHQNSGHQKTQHQKTRALKYRALKYRARALRGGAQLSGRKGDAGVSVRTDVKTGARPRPPAAGQSAREPGARQPRAREPRAREGSVQEPAGRGPRARGKGARGQEDQAPASQGARMPAGSPSPVLPGRPRPARRRAAGPGRAPARRGQGRPAALAPDRAPGPPRPAGAGAQAGAWAGASSAAMARTPFIVFVTALLGGGLICLLVINTILATGSYQITSLQQAQTARAQQVQALRQQVAQESAPSVIAKRARQLGMVEPPLTKFLNLKTGKINRQPATEPGVPAVPGYTP